MRIRKSAVILGIVCLLLFQCAIEAPKAPGYQTPVNLVLIDTTFTMTDLIKKTDNLIINRQSELVEVVVSGESDTFAVENQLAIESEQFSHQINLEDYLTINRAMLDTSLTLIKVIPELASYEGTQQVIPPFTISSQPTNSFTLGKIKDISIETGTAEIFIENGMPIALQQIKIKVIDEKYGFVEEISFPGPLVSGESANYQMDLTGKKFSSQLYFEISASSSGSGTHTVIISRIHNIRAGILINDMQLESAAAYVSSVRYEADEEILIQQNNISIKEARFGSGQAQLHLWNHTGLEAQTIISFEDVFKDDGTNLELAFYLTSNQELFRSIDLSDLIFRPQHDQTIFDHKFRIKIRVTTFEAGSEVVELTKDDWAAVDIIFNKLALNTVSGILDHEQLTIDAEFELPDIPAEVDNIRFGNAQLNFCCYNSINFPLQVNLDMKGISDSGNEVTLSINEFIATGNSQQEKKTTLALTQMNSNILDFLNNYPQRLEITGQAVVGDGATEGSLSRGDYLRLEYELISPLNLILEQKTIRADTTTLNIEPDDFESSGGSNEDVISADLTNRIVTGTLEINIGNHLPVGVDVELFIADQLETLFSAPQSRLGPIQIPAGKVDAAGYVVETNFKTNSIILTKDDLDIFHNESKDLKKIYLGTQLHIHGSDGKSVVVSANDFISLQANSAFTIEVSESK